MPVTVKDFRGERQEKLPKVSINFFERVPFHANNGGAAAPFRKPCASFRRMFHARTHADLHGIVAAKSLVGVRLSILSG